MISIYLAFLLQAFAAEKNLSGAMHGDKMMVDHVRLGSGQEILRVRQVAVKTDKQIVQLKLAEDEVLGNDRDFHCEDERGAWVYAVISKKRAREHDIFPAERAWKVNQDKVSLDRVSTISKVKCYFAPEGEDTYPFK